MRNDRNKRVAISSFCCKIEEQGTVKTTNALFVKAKKKSCQKEDL